MATEYPSLSDEYSTGTNELIAATTKRTGFLAIHYRKFYTFTVGINK